MSKDKKNVSSNIKFRESIEQLTICLITAKIEYDKLEKHEQKIYEFLDNALNSEFDIEHYLLNAIVDLNEFSLHSDLDTDTINGIACMREYANFVKSIREIKFKDSN